MADDKPKKPAAEKKIIDVKHGEGDAASGTSRQIILNNRPIMKDPMMAEVSELANAQAGIPQTEEGEKPSAPAVNQKPKVIQVSHGDDAAEEVVPPKPDDAMPAEPTPAKAEPKKPEPKKPEPAKSAVPKAVKVSVADESAVEATKADDEDPAAAVDTAKQEEPSINADAEPEATETAEDTADTPADAADSPAPEQAEPAAAKDATPTGGGFAGADAPSDTPQPGRSTDSASEVADGDKSAKATDGKDAKPVLPPGQLTTEQQKAFDKGEYFLPITTAETRRMRLEIILTIVFVAILLVALLDIMLDAGLLHISGIQPLTHFFN